MIYLLSDKYALGGRMSSLEARGDAVGWLGRWILHGPIAKPLRNLTGTIVINI
jgi:hypothetical protein